MIPEKHLQVPAEFLQRYWLCLILAKCHGAVRPAIGGVIPPSPPLALFLPPPLGKRSRRIVGSAGRIAPSGQEASSMHLSDHERDKLLIYVASQVAKERRGAV